MDRSLATALFAVVALSLPVVADDAPPAAPAVEEITTWLNAPEQAEWLTDEGDLDLSKLRGKVVVIKFWTMSCGGCRQLRPAFNAMHEDEALDDVQVLSVTQLGGGQTLEATETYVRENIEFPVAVMRTAKTARNYDVSKLPFAVVIDKQGRLVWTGNPFQEQFKAAIARARQETPQGE